MEYIFFIDSVLDYRNTWNNVNIHLEKAGIFISDIESKF